MADVRAKHFTMGPSLLNQQPAAFNGAADALYRYGPRGPARIHNRPLNGVPTSIEEHVGEAIRKVPGLNPRQKLALRNSTMAMLRDIHFLRLLMDEARAKGPWSEAAVHGMDSQGNPF